MDRGSRHLDTQVISYAIKDNWDHPLEGCFISSIVANELFLVQADDNSCGLAGSDQANWLKCPINYTEIALFLGLNGNFWHENKPSKKSEPLGLRCSSILEGHFGV